MQIGISALHVRSGKSGSHEPYMVHLVRALALLDTQHRFTLFVTPSNKSLFDLDSDRVELIVYPKLAEIIFLRILFEQIVLPIDARRRSLDVVHYGGTAGSILMQKNDVVTIHHDSVTQRMSMSKLKNLYYDLVLRINRKAGRLITPTDVYAKQLVEFFGYKPEQMSPVHHGVNPLFQDVAESDVDLARQEWEIESNVILTITNTLPHKNIANLLRAFDLLINQNETGTQLVMVGNVDESILDNLISEIADNKEQLRSRIKVISFLPHEELPPIYAAATVFTFVSKVETFGMPLVEAMACGLPIIASDIPVHREVLKGAGLMVSPNEPEDISNALLIALKDRTTREQLISKSKARAKDFSWRKTAIETLGVYEEVYKLTKSIKTI